MSKPTYEEFYYKGKKYPIEVLEQYASKSDRNIGNYKGNIYCPACHKAHLSYTHRTGSKSSYLSAIRTEEHIKGCPYSYDLLKTKDAKKKFKVFSDSEMNDKMHSIMRNLCCENENPTLINKEEISFNNHPLKIKNPTKNKSYNYLRKKSLNSKLDDVEKGELCAFYAKRTVLEASEKNSEKTNKPYYLLKVTTKKTSIEIFEFVNPEDLKPEKNYNIVCIGYLNKFGKIQPIDRNMRTTLLQMI